MRPGSGSGAPSAAYDTVKATNALARAVGTVLYHEHNASWHGVLHTSWFEDVSTPISIPLFQICLVGFFGPSRLLS